MLKYIDGKSKIIAKTKQIIVFGNRNWEFKLSNPILLFEIIYNLIDFSFIILLSIMILIFSNIEINCNSIDKNAIIKPGEKDISWLFVM